MRIPFLLVGVFLGGKGVLAGDGLCQGLMNCNPENAVAFALPGIAKLLLEVAAGLSVLFMVWSGILMLISMGDDSKAAQAKWAIIYALVGLLGALLSQAFVGTVAETPLLNAIVNDAHPIASIILRLVQFLVNAVNVLFFVAIIFAGIRMLVSHGQPEEFNRAKKVIEWAVIGAIIVNVARTLVRVVLSLFGV